MNQAATGPIRVVVCGGTGKMGWETVKTVLSDARFSLVGVVSPTRAGQPLSGQFEFAPKGMCFDGELKALLQREQPDVAVDFTHPGVVFSNSMAMIDAGARPVIGTTGLSADQLQAMDEALRRQALGGLVIPNFAIGAVLLMKFAREAARYFDHAEIVELHHHRKADAPSGTALKTAELMRESRERFGMDNAPEQELLPGARGAQGPADVRIHSVRLPGLVAHQEVLFGSAGQLLTLRHDSFDRACFMPGVALCIQKAMTLTGLTYGLESLL